MDDFLKLDSRERNFLFQNASTGKEIKVQL